jgi:hypothetical protein
MAKLGAAAASKLVHQASKETTRLRVLLAGDAVSGKTTCLRTIPDALKSIGVEEPKIVIIDLDQGAELFVDDPAFHVFRFGGIPGSEPKCDEALDWWVNNELKNMEGVHVIVADSLSALSLMAIATITDRNSRFGSAPQLQDWSHEMYATQKFCLDLQNCPVSHGIITICHTHYEKDDLTGRAYNNLVLTGKLPKRLIRFFPEIYYADVTGFGTKAKFEWLVRPEQGTLARSQFMAGPRILQDFSPVFKARFGVKS